MINANELRIGNRILTASMLGGEYEETVVDASILLQIEDNALRVEPIPLTEELLLRCGFEAVQDGYYKKGEITWNIYNEQCHFIDWELPHIQHLHQLQNIFYFLSKEELNIEFA